MKTQFIGTLWMIWLGCVSNYKERSMDGPVEDGIVDDAAPS